MSCRTNFHISIPGTSFTTALSNGVNNFVSILLVLIRIHRDASPLSTVSPDDFDLSSIATRYT